eukprot:564227-Hanusia_phi.AAC.1
MATSQSSRSGTLLTPPKTSTSSPAASLTSCDALTSSKDSDSLSEGAVQSFALMTSLVELNFLFVREDSPGPTRLPWSPRPPRPRPLPRPPRSVGSD